MTGSVSAYFTGVKGGLVMSMIAFSIVFLVIMALMLMMVATKYLAATIDGGKGKDSGNKAGSAAPQAPASPSAPAKAVAVQSGDEGELMAVISAAIAATLGSVARVIAFSPVVKAPVATSWKFVARMSNSEGFQD